MKLHILAIGRARKAYAEMCAEYSKRITGKLAIKEITAKSSNAECAALLDAVPDKATIVLLDENGKDLTSREFAAKLEKWQDQGVRDLAFIIGGADGLNDDIKKRANFVLGLGKKTWPHMLARVMLIEQLYRAQQINNGHPYHRD